MTLDEYQQEANLTAIYPDRGENLTYPIMGLVGEVGELANKYQKVLRGDRELTYQARPAIAAELGDCPRHCHQQPEIFPAK